ncbi:MAG: hypothetical protein OEW56_03265 [Gemmatimonadota bacterium]|nr:hypothetical protein [Gemmatimonadota bacterium]
MKAWWVASLLLGLSLAGPPAAASQDSCGVGPPLPAYAHNDYQNARPLFDALALGYQGVEADFHLVRGQLLVAHDRHDVQPDRTLAALYLQPLQAWVARCGRILPDGKPLLLNIEAKTSGIEAYRALVQVLRRYRDILTVVRDGTEYPGPVQVVLVGWYPPLTDLEAETERLVAVQWYADAEAVPAAPAHLIRLVSLDYGDSIGWDGTGIRPATVAPALQRLIAARDAVPGRIARLHNVPVNAAVYAMALHTGVDLLGTQDLTATRDLLSGVR